MKSKFQRWYGCDESDRFELTNALADRLGMHVVVSEDVLDPINIDEILGDAEAARPGVYMLRSVSGWPDVRNGYALFIVAGFYEWVRSDDPSGRYPTLEGFERGLGGET